MDTLSSVVAVMTVTTLVVLLMGIALPFIAGSPSWRSYAWSGGQGNTPAEYLYVPCVGNRGHLAGKHRWVQEVPIVRKTAKLIYYTSDTWDRHDAVVSPGCISREQFETDTRCHNDCPAGSRGTRCARHGYTRERYPHGEGRRHHGYPAGVIPIPSNRHRPGQAGWLFFATHEAAEDYLHRGEREGAKKAVSEAPLIKELRRVMANAHPDRGGTAEQFIEARRQYKTALQRRQGTIAGTADLIVAGSPGAGRSPTC
jgi:hypothetical protein